MWLGVLNATAYAVAMAYLESAIVVYLRRLYYPQGLSFPLTIADIEGLRYLMAHQSVFDFPLAIIDTPTLLLELGRETATMVMLATVGIAAGRTKVGKFAYFLLLFGVWDIWYYIWLKVFLGWPPSPLTWDVLFLIPVPWIGPVLAPAVVSTVLVSGGLLLLRRRARGQPIRFPASLRMLALTGGLLVLASFMLDFRVVLRQMEPPPFRWGL